MRLPQNIITFAKTDESLKAYKQFKDYYNHKLNKVGHFDSALSLEEKKEKLDFATRAEIARLSGVGSVEGIPAEVMASNPMYQWAAFAVVGAMVDAVLPDTILDSIGLYTDLRVGGYGDSFAFDIGARDLFVVSKYGNGKRHGEIHKQFKGQVTIIPENRLITVQTSLYKVLAGLEDMAEFAMKAAASMETQMTIDAYSAFNTAMEALPNTGDAALRVVGYTQDDLVELCQKVTAFNGGRKAVIVGTHLAVSKILPADSNYRYDIQSDFVKIGYVKNFHGFDVMALPQVADATTDFQLALDDNNIYIVSPSGDKLIKGALEGATMSVVEGHQSTANLTENVTMNKRWGFAVATSSIAGLIELS
jgi:hypothetical protein